MKGMTNEEAESVLSMIMNAGHNYAELYRLPDMDDSDPIELFNGETLELVNGVFVHTFNEGKGKYFYIASTVQSVYSEKRETEETEMEKEKC